MAKKRTSLSQTLFGQIDPYGAPVEETAPNTASDSLATLPLATICPDPDQPRQLLPPAVGQALAAGQLTPTGAMQSWLGQVDINNQEASPRPLRELRRLADSIAQHGLINPITVRQARADEKLPPGVDYVIVTGERRYWSHVLLASEGRTIQEGNQVSMPDLIKVVVMPAGVSVRAHQLIENLMREDINAVEKARGLWGLRYELSGVNHGSPAASDLASTLVPWSQVEEAVGISKRYRIFVTNVLDLNADAQRLVSEHSLSERVIRPIVQKLKGRPDLQIEALQQVIQWREHQETDTETRQPMFDSTEALVAELLHQAEAGETAPSPTRKIPPPIRHSPGAEQFRNKVQGALHFLNKLQEPDLIDLTQNLATTPRYTEVVEELRDLRERIDALLDAVDVYTNQLKRAG